MQRAFLSSRILFGIVLWAVCMIAAAENPWRWGTIKQDSCTFTGKRQYSSRLWDIPSGTDWNYACANAPRNVMGIDFARPTRCVDMGVSGMWGEWDVADSRCASTPPAGPVKGIDDTLTVDAPLEGYADLHVHQMANLGFGESLFWGGAYGTPSEVLAPIPDAYKSGHDRVEAIMDGDYVGALLATATHAEDGYPTFANWPANGMDTHQQVYEDWLYRAYQGGLRLMVMMAINNEDMFGRGENDGGIFNHVIGSLAKTKTGRGSNDMEAIEYQIRGAYAMQDYIDAKYGGAGKGWYRIVKDPEEASSVIASGKLAIILGAEVDHLFNCDLDRPCSEDIIRKGLNRLEALGVNHLFVVHHKHTRISGAGQFNLLTTGDTYECRETTEPCAADGLEPLGETLIREMASRGMLIDVDHTSWRAFDDALTVLEELRYPGVFTGHLIAFDQQIAGQTEQAVKGSAAKRIIALGGMVGLMIGSGGQEYAGATNADIPVKIGCAAGAAPWAQTYLYMRDLMSSGLDGTGGRIGFGSDFNGFADWPLARFAENGTACPTGQYKAQNGALIPMPPAVTYPFALPSRLVPAAIGGSKSLPLFNWYRQWNYNTEGVAHVGLVPDFVEDLRLHGLSVSDLEPLYRSARGYVEVWRKARARTVPNDRHALRWVPSVPTQTITWAPTGFATTGNARLVYASSSQPVCRNLAGSVGALVNGACQAASAYAAPTIGAITAFHSGRCIDASGPGNGAAALQWTCHGGTNQQWSVEALSDGNVQLRDQRSSKCLMVNGASTSDGANVVINTCSGATGQRWRAERVGESFRFVAAHSGKCLDVNGASRDDGAALIQWTCHGASNQSWQMSMLRSNDFELLYQADTGRYAWQSAATSAFPIVVTANDTNTICRAKGTLQVGSVSSGVCKLITGSSTSSFDVLVQAL